MQFNSNESMNPWIFGGSGRSGKTSMVLALNGKEGKIIGFQLEGLFAAYSEKYPVVFSNREKKNINHSVSS